MWDDLKQSLNKPISRDMPVSRLLLYFILFLVVAFIVWDTLKLLAQWAAQATEATVETITS